MSTYSPVFVFRCSVCGGENVMIHEGNPEEQRYCCKHHGEGDGDDGDFEDTGVGVLKDKFRFQGFYIVEHDSAPMTLEDEFAVEEADILDLDEHRAYKDYFEVVLKDRDMGEVAEERDVVRQTVYSNVRHARNMLSDDDEDDG